MHIQSTSSCLQPVTDVYRSCELYKVGFLLRFITSDHQTMSDGQLRIRGMLRTAPSEVEVFFDERTDSGLGLAFS